MVKLTKKQIIMGLLDANCCKCEYDDDDDEEECPEYCPINCLLEKLKQLGDDVKFDVARTFAI